MRTRRRWRKLGLLYSPLGNHAKLRTHAANPLPIHLEGDQFRILFNGRDIENRSSIGAVDVDLRRKKILHIHREPHFQHGVRGSFYADGVSLGNRYQYDGRHYVAFMGWQLLPAGRWVGTIGRLTLSQNMTLEMEDDRPMLTLNTIDQISLSYPWIMPVASKGYYMWYGSTVTQDVGNGEMLHPIHYATSKDGNQWTPCGQAIPYEVGPAQAFSHPSAVGSEKNGYHMWFSVKGYKNRAYRIGYAYSDNAQQWELRLQDAGIEVSESGWDSEMIEYPFVFDHNNDCYMLYCGNGYGKTGFGLAVLEQF